MSVQVSIEGMVSGLSLMALTTIPFKMELSEIVSQRTCFENIVWHGQKVMDQNDKKFESHTLLIGKAGILYWQRNG